MLICNIGKIIDEKGYKRKYIADKLGVTQQQLSNWVNMRNFPPVDKLFLLAKILNCLVDDLYTLKEG